MLLESLDHLLKRGILMLMIHGSQQLFIAGALVGECWINASSMLGQTGEKVMEIKNLELFSLEESFDRCFS